MLTGVQIYDARSRLVQTLGMSKLNPATKFVIVGMDGEGPVKADISMSKFGSSDGDAIQSSRVGSRNLVIKLGYNPNYAIDETIEDLRLDLYAFLAPGADVRLRFLNNKMETVEISGRVESLDPDIWSATPSIQVSILCPLPYFHSLVTSSFTCNANESKAFTYKGSARAGFKFTINATSNINYLQISNGFDPTFVWSSSLANGSTLVMSTVKGDRYLRKNGSDTALDGIVGGSLFMTLGPLTPTFIFVPKNGDDLRDATGTMSYVTQYVGI